MPISTCIPLEALFGQLKRLDIHLCACELQANIERCDWVWNRLIKNADEYVQNSKTDTFLDKFNKVLKFFVKPVWNWT